jgi:DNA invertase Pin-like site-specific DNA recombinase
MEKRKRGRPKGSAKRLYTVYDNRTDMPIIIDGTAKECAKAMGIKLITFYPYVTSSREGKPKKWHIEYIDAGEVDDYE